MKTEKCPSTLRCPIASHCAMSNNAPSEWRHQNARVRCEKVLDCNGASDEWITWNLNAFDGFQWEHSFIKVFASTTTSAAFVISEFGRWHLSADDSNASQCGRCDFYLKFCILNERAQRYDKIPWIHISQQNLAVEMGIRSMLCDMENRTEKWGGIRTGIAGEWCGQNGRCAFEVNTTFVRWIVKDLKKIRE